MLVTGTSPDGNLVEVIELRNHPWFVAVQCHPEFKSKPTKAHPLFRDFDTREPRTARWQEKRWHISIPASGDVAVGIVKLLILGHFQ